MTRILIYYVYTLIENSLFVGHKATRESFIPGQIHVTPCAATATIRMHYKKCSQLISSATKQRLRDQRRVCIVMHTSPTKTVRRCRNDTAAFSL
jgi:hypothetical protein